MFQTFPDHVPRATGDTGSGASVVTADASEPITEPSFWKVTSDQSSSFFLQVIARNFLLLLIDGHTACLNGVEIYEKHWTTLEPAFQELVHNWVQDSLPSQADTQPASQVCTEADSHDCRIGIISHWHRKASQISQLPPPHSTPGQ